jgi:hypothetical protein
LASVGRKTAFSYSFRVMLAAGSASAKLSPNPVGRTRRAYQVRAAK